MDANLVLAVDGYDVAINVTSPASRQLNLQWRMSQESGS
jgi:hypothetical protein